MGSLRLTLCTGLLAACALTPAAHAADGSGGGVSVTPSSPAPGADIALRVTGCSARTATAASTAFVADVQLAGADGTLAGDSRVRASAQPGSYEVKISCAEFVIQSKITVVSQSEQSQQSESRPQSESHQPSQPQSHSQTSALSDTPASPVAPVHAGGGGTAHFASVDVRGAGPGTGQAVTGLVLAGVAAAAVALLSARRGRGRD
ncbi:hypothetical protein OHB14_39235 [Streptomyces sp. NBC_01613]|uniref:hypothetical protein n=1 Tax=Streptomyces sp. NBC_01613 TaxID=2975896 RepID=UPI00386D46DA